MAFSIALRYVTKVTNIGVSVCGILFYLLKFRYTIKQLESRTLTRSCVSSCYVQAKFCRHTNCSQDFKMSAQKEAVEMAIMFLVASRLCMHACVRVKNDNHISCNAWPEQVVGLVKRVVLCQDSQSRRSPYYLRHMPIAKFELYTENAEAWEHDYSLSTQCESESC